MKIHKEDLKNKLYLTPNNKTVSKRIFVTYGNEPYYNSLNRIRHEAEESGEFDLILCYTDKDLPKEITDNILFQYKRGGGYWLWKPWVVLQALNHAQANDIVVYSDCGNTIYSDSGWEKLFDRMNKANGLFFYNGDKMERRTRRETLEHFGMRGGYRTAYQIISGFFIINKSSYEIIREWYDSMLHNPNIVMDVPQERLSLESPKFIEHRHDQAVLSCIVYNANKEKKLRIIPEQSERLRKHGQPIYNSRISDDGRRSGNRTTPIYRLIIRDLIVVPYRKLRTWCIRNL